MNGEGIADDAFPGKWPGGGARAARGGGQAGAAEDIRLSNNQRIACGRGLNAGKLQNINCRSYAYLFNTQTSEFYRCQVSVAVTRDNKEVLKVDTDGGCTLKARIFPDNSSYAFDATETERRTPTPSSAPAARRSGPPTPPP